MTAGLNPDDRLREAGVRTEEAPLMVGRLRLYTPRELLMFRPRKYLLEGLIAPGDLSVWWGAPKCGKTFLIARIAFGLALGVGIWGRHPAQPVRVLYCSAEGHGGIPLRLGALLRELGDPGDRFAVVNQTLTIGPPADHLPDLIAAAQHHRPHLIVIDTLARTFGDGDEDRAQDMSGFLASLDRLREEGHAAGDDPPHIAVIHHGSKDPAAKTPRGSGALLGAADLVVKVTKGAEGKPSFATIEMAKDDADGLNFAFQLRVVEVGQDGEAHPRETCIAEEAGGVGGTKPTYLTKGADRALSYLNDLLATGGDKMPVGHSCRSDACTRVVPYDEWRAICRRRGLSARGEKSAENRAFSRAAQALLDARMIATGDHDGVRVVWVVAPSGT